MKVNGNAAIVLTVLLLVATIAVFESAPIDLFVQDRLYDPVHGWCVDRDAPTPKLVFYDGPKFVLGVFGALLFVCLVVPPSRAGRLPFSRRAAAFLILCVGLTPAVVGILKKATGVFAPYKIERYGGTQPYRSLLESIPHVPGRERGHQFPAGHCSGAFALMALYFVGRGRRWKLIGLSAGLVTGWTVGAYQMMKGSHYLSHTLVTMIIAWLIVLVLSRAFRLGR